MKAAIQSLAESPQGARDLTIHSDQVMKGLAKIAHRRVAPAQFQLADFPGLEGREWDRTKTLILHGRTGVGKTELAKSLLPEALFVTHLDMLRSYELGGYEGVIFDDMNFIQTWPEFYIGLTDTSEGREIHGRNVNGYLPKGTPRIFTTNREPFGPGQLFCAATPAVMRRCQVWEIQSKDDFYEKVYYNEENVEV